MNRLITALATGALLLGAGAAAAQNETAKKINKEEVSFKTADGVQLRGTFYPSVQGARAPTVLMIHKLGGKRTDAGWEELALFLQAKEYAVLTFDLRGHGGSTEIRDPAVFWGMPHNQQLVKGYNLTKKHLTMQDFRVGYIPYLANDIAAARHDLDNRNDNGQCNTSNLVVIGAEDGATLGFYWIVTEFKRHRVYTEDARLLPRLLGGGAPVNDDMAGDDLVGAIWLSYKRKPGFTASASLSFPYSEWKAAGAITPVRDKVQMWFAHGAKDAAGASDAAYMYRGVLDADKRKDRLPLTSMLPIEGTNLRGVALASQKTLPTQERIKQFIEEAVKKRLTQTQLRRDASKYKPMFIEPLEFGFGR